METSEIINRVKSRLINLGIEPLDVIINNLILVLNDYTISKKQTELAIAQCNKTTKAIQMFFVSKKVEGCSDKTLAYYGHVVRFFFSVITKPIEELSPDDIRYYIAKRSTQDRLSKVSQDNELRVLKAFFKWCAGEGYIDKIPTLNIKPIKQQYKVKKPFSEIEVEKLRKSTTNARNLAIVDTLFSTGVRVSELCSMNISDIENDEAIVMGKGGKERIVYLNAKALLSIREYLNSRSDSEDALFVSIKKPHKRITTSTVESMIRQLGERNGVANCHPHRFRRTTATTALNRGMPIEQVSQMLGHSNIETTTIYARSEKENVKSSHRKYVV